jgi:hypothetical protein
VILLDSRAKPPGLAGVLLEKVYIPNDYNCNEYHEEM